MHALIALVSMPILLLWTPTAQQTPQGELVAGQQVVHLTGTPREVGLAHGQLLKDEIRENVQIFVHESAAAPGGVSLEELDTIAQRQIKAWPAAMKEELDGVAEGSGVAIEDLRRLQVAIGMVPGRTGAAFHTRTLGARLLHVLTLEPATKRLPHAIIAVHRPAEGLPSVTLGWAGYLGAVVGLNEEGISVSSLKVAGRPDAEPGLSGPMLARVILAEAKTLPSASALIDESPRAGAWAMVIGDGKVPSARAIEVTAAKIAEFGPADVGEKSPPFEPLDNAVRRSNQFVHPSLVTGPTDEASVERYADLTKFFSPTDRPLGSIEAVHQLRSATASGSINVVVNASELDLWVGLPADEAGRRDAVRYRWNDLLAGQPLSSKVLVDRSDDPLDPMIERLQVATIQPKRHEESSVPEMYQVSNESFTVEMMPDNVGSGIVRTMVRIPSPMTTSYVENNTIPVEVFRPRGEGPWPYIIVTHIAGGDFELSRFVATTLANSGLACAFIKLPYYGERQPPGKEVKMLQPDVEVASGAMKQAIMDIRRVCDWIEAQPDAYPGRIGICGISLGSITGSLAAAIEPRITHACLIIGGGSLHDLIFESVEKEAREFRRLWTESGGTRESLGELMKSFDPITYADRLEQRVVFMINASQDESVPVVCGKALWEAAGRQKIVWYPCGHYTIVRYIMPALQQTVQFFKEWPDREHNNAVATGN